jgi:hypothetical protein
MSNGRDVEDLGEWYWVNSNTGTYGESRSPNQICQWTLPLDFHGNWRSMSASVSVSVECEHEHIVIIDSLVDLHEHGGDSDGPTIVRHQDSKLSSNVDLSPHTRRLARASTFA